MKIYIASSWKNQHAVEMLTALLRDRGHEIFSFVENNHGEQQSYQAIENYKPVPFEEWVWSERGTKSFIYDSQSAMTCDLCIYISPSGKDAAAECGMAYGKNIPIYGLASKGEDFGLMRRMMDKWFDNYVDLLVGVNDFADNLNVTEAF
jgi:hypothetical protein